MNAFLLAPLLLATLSGSEQAVDHVQLDSSKSQLDAAYSYETAIELAGSNLTISRMPSVFVDRLSLAIRQTGGTDPLLLSAWTGYVTDPLGGVEHFALNQSGKAMIDLPYATKEAQPFWLRVTAHDGSVQQAAFDAMSV